MHLTQHNSKIEDAFISNGTARTKGEESDIQKLKASAQSGSIIKENTPPPLLNTYPWVRLACTGYDSAKNQIQNKYQDSGEGKAQTSKSISSCYEQIRENKQMHFILGLLLSNWPGSKAGDESGAVSTQGKIEGSALSGPHLTHILPQLILSGKRQIQNSLPSTALALSFQYFTIHTGKQLRQEILVLPLKLLMHNYCQLLQSDPCQSHTSKQSEGIKVTRCEPQEQIQNCLMVVALAWCNSRNALWSLASVQSTK